MLAKGAIIGAANTGPVISQPVAITLIVLILGASIYLWTQRQLRSRAAMVTIAAILLFLAYFGFGPNAGP